MKALDTNTIENMGVPSLVLMERASLKVVEEMEKIPQVGDRFEFGGFCFTVSKADKRSVIEVIAKRLPEPMEEEE